MCKNCTPADPATRAGTVRDQVRGTVFAVDVPGVGTVQAQSRGASIRPLMNVAVVQVGGAWRIV